uniref:Uncharacterized protein n=1 Tax=Arundo donax TaxID=35708 RepID=A0A0A8YPG6_ARUDO
MEADTNLRANCIFALCKLIVIYPKKS